MPDLVGIGTLVALIVVGAVLVGLAYALVRLKNRSGRRRVGADEDIVADSDGRIEVLESTPVDADRRLVLVRCDNVEHLIMVGGPADLVVENDVRKSRLGAKPAAKSSPDLASRSAAPLHERADPAAARAPEPQAMAPRPALPKPPEQQGPEQQGPEPRPAEARPQEARPAETRAVALPRPALTAVPAPANQPGARKDAGQSAPAAAQDNRAAAPRIDDAAGRRQQAPEPQIGGRREAPAPAIKRGPQVQAPAAAANAEPMRQPPREPGAGERWTTPQGEAGGNRPVGLPAAEVPWPEPDSVENEIVRALSSESGFGAPQAQPPQALVPVARSASSPGTTLGDLAERLEEALAREVQSASKGRARVDANLDTFAFDRGGEASEPKLPGQQRDRKDIPKALAAAPEPEVRRDRSPAPERQEEAPVISLNARRREPVDPLEDEMARLLGELTGDTTRR